MPRYIVMCSDNPGAFCSYKDLETACAAARQLSKEFNSEYYVLANVAGYSEGEALALF